MIFALSGIFCIDSIFPDISETVPTIVWSGSKNVLDEHSGHEIHCLDFSEDSLNVNVHPQEHFINSMFYTSFQTILYHILENRTSRKDEPQ